MKDLKFILKYLFLYLPAGLIVFVGSAMLQSAFLDPLPGYRAFTAAAARAGQVIAEVAVALLLLALAFIVVYVLTHGKKDASEGAVTEEGPMPMRLGPSFGRSKRKYLVKRNDYITMESLVRGTATPGERMLVLSTFVLFLSFFSIFLGAGLMFMENLIILGLFPVIPGLWLYGAFLGPVWKDYRKEKAKLRADPAAKLDAELR
jgi:hypothetical protein